MISRAKYKLDTYSLATLITESQVKVLRVELKYHPVSLMASTYFLKMPMNCVMCNQQFLLVMLRDQVNEGPVQSLTA